MKGTEALKAMKEEALTALKTVKDIPSLQQTKAVYIGKKGKMAEVMKLMKDLSNEERPLFGQHVNEVKQEIETMYSNVLTHLEGEIITRKLNDESIDVTLPGREINQGTIHPLTRMTEEIEDLLIGMGYTIAEGPEIESDHNNFELLNLPVGHPARDMQDSFYIDAQTLLRTHTSPVQARTMLASNPKPIRILCPGKVYRRDSDDATHSHQFMQIEGLVLGADVTLGDLKGVLLEIARKLFGEDRDIRLRPSYFPFTEPSVEVDVSCYKCHGEGCSLCKRSGWIEVLGAGMVHPNVLTMCGYDPNQIQGFAFGIGVERMAMLKYGIDDIRHFYANDLRFLKQFKEVS